MNELVVATLVCFVLGVGTLLLLREMIRQVDQDRRDSGKQR